MAQGHTVHTQGSLDWSQVAPVKTWAPLQHDTTSGQRIVELYSCDSRSCFPPCSGCLLPSALPKSLSSFKAYLKLTFCLKAFLKTWATFELSPSWLHSMVYIVCTKHFATYVLLHITLLYTILHGSLS